MPEDFESPAREHNHRNLRLDKGQYEAFLAHLEEGKGLLLVVQGSLATNCDCLKCSFAAELLNRWIIKSLLGSSTEALEEVATILIAGAEGYLERTSQENN